jgi:hypothetical protein
LSPLLWFDSCCRGWELGWDLVLLLSGLDFLGWLSGASPSWLMVYWIYFRLALEATIYLSFPFPFLVLILRYPLAFGVFPWLVRSLLLLCTLLHII